MPPYSNQSTLKLLNGALYALLGSASVMTAAAAQPPSWWNDPIREDTGNIFFTASGTSKRGFDEALQQAQRQALEQIVDRAGCSLESRPYVLGRVNGWSLHAREDRKHRRRYHVWIILKYPKNELSALASHVQNGHRRLEAAMLAFTQKRFTEALADANDLAAEYPVGGQPILQTERALLLASDCNVALGLPKAGIESCQAIMSGSTDGGFKKNASARIAAIHTDYTNLLFRGMFRGKRLSVQCLADLNGTLSAWEKLQSEISSIVKRAGGSVVHDPAARANADSIERFISDNGKRLRAMQSMAVDGQRAGQNQHSTEHAQVLERRGFSVFRFNRGGPIHERR